MTEPEFNFGDPIPKAEPGNYPAHVVGLDVFTSKEGTPDAQTLLRWDFALYGTDDPDMPGHEIIIDGVTSLATGPRSKMRAWVTALGANLDGMKVSLSTLRQAVIGKDCMVQIVIVDGYSRVARDGGVTPPPRKPAKPQQIYEGMEQDEPAKGKVENIDDLPF